MKPTKSITGTVRMANGDTRDAYRNTYTGYVVDASGAVVETVETRTEFLLDTNGANGQGRKYRKTSDKQAATFVALKH